MLERIEGDLFLVLRVTVGFTFCPKPGVVRGWRLSKQGKKEKEFLVPSPTKTPARA